MLPEVLRFEIAYRLKKPAIYIYFTMILLFSCLVFMKGFLPLGEDQHINSPASIAQFCSGMTMMMMLVTSAIMSVPLFRDIEYNTRSYYFSLPVSAAGYFWGRFWGSFIVLLFISLALPAGIYMGARLGSLMGISDIKHYGPNKLQFYLEPYFVIVLPNLFFSSGLFFGLVALLRSIKAVYSSGILVLLGYLIGNFFIHAHPDPYIIHLSDPFALNGIRSILGGWQAEQKNTLTIPLSGLFLANRIIWNIAGLFIILFTWKKFSFEKFLHSAANKKLINPSNTAIPVRIIPQVSFHNRYRKSIFFSLMRIETFNIIRDNYFWIIILAGNIFLGIIFSNGPGNFGIRDFPRTSQNLFLLNNNFLIFIFCIIFFYAGEAIHREKLSQFNLINDALPPATWIFHLSKFLSVLLISIFLLSSAMLSGMIAQMAKGYFQFNFPVYFKVLFLCIFPRLIAITMLAFAIHILVNNKFVAIGIGIAWLVLCQLAVQSGILDYNLFLYSFGPFYAISDFDNIGHMMKPVSWFNAYWISCGLLLLLAGYLLYNRGIISSLKDRGQIAVQRFNKVVLCQAILLCVLFTGCGAFIYYNVSYLNHYVTAEEDMEQHVMMEKTLKPFASMAVPKVSAINMTADIFPEKQTALFKARVVIVNKSSIPISQLLTDGGFLQRYEISNGSNPLPYTEPLLYPRPAFSLFGPKNMSSGYRLYTLAQTLAPDDSAVLFIQSEYSFKGFQNSIYGANFLHNGALMGICLPGFGYDAEDELNNEDDRKKYDLPKRVPEHLRAGPLKDADRLNSNPYIDLLDFNITISTSLYQTAIGPGDLVKKWTAGGRNYFTYSGKQTGIYMLPGIASAEYREWHDSVNTGSRTIDIGIYSHSAHNKNISRLIDAYKTSVRFCDQTFGPYMYKQMRLVETPVYAPLSTNIAGTDFFSELYGWNVNSRIPSDIDHFLFNSARQVARQWWGNRVAPNNVPGSLALKDGMSTFCALLIYESVYGKFEAQKVLYNLFDWYLLNAQWNAVRQQPVLSGNMSTETDNKVALVLYGLKETIGDEPLIKALVDFKQRWEYKTTGPFAGISDLYSLLKNYVPAKHLQFLEDSWEKICFYDNSIVSAAFTTNRSGEKFLNVILNVRKQVVDSKGTEREEKMDGEKMDIALWGKNENGKKFLIDQQSFPLHSGRNEIQIPSSIKPAFIQLDPGYKMMDRNRYSNREYSRIESIN